MNTNSSNADLTPDVSAQDHARGSNNAPLTLVQFGDYECPFTAASQWEVKLLMDTFGERLQFVFRHFPLIRKHMFAMRAAEAAESASAQGKFWEMHEYLLSRQHALSSSDGLMQAAAELKLNTAQFSRDLGSHKFISRVRADVNSGIRSGVVGTPTYFINGSLYDGRDDFDTLASVLNDTLAKAHVLPSPKLKQNH